MTDVAQAVFRLRDVLNGQNAVLVPCGFGWAVGPPSTREGLYTVLTKNQQSHKKRSDLLAAVQNFKAHLRVAEEEGYFVEKTYYPLVTAKLKDVFIDSGVSGMFPKAFARASQAFDVSRGSQTAAALCEYQAERSSEQDNEQDSEQESEQTFSDGIEQRCRSTEAPRWNQQQLLQNFGEVDNLIVEKRLFSEELKEALGRLKFLVAPSVTVHADKQPAGTRLVVKYVHHIFICTTREFLARPLLSNFEAVYNTEGFSMSDRSLATDWSVLLACTLAGGKLHPEQEAQMLVDIDLAGCWEPARLALQCFEKTTRYGPLTRMMLTPSENDDNAQGGTPRFLDKWRALSGQDFQDLVVGVTVDAQVHGFIRTIYKKINDSLLPKQKETKKPRYLYADTIHRGIK
jgi:hypothetical protein